MNGRAGESCLSAPEIFLSYNREDSARAKLFADAFGAEGFAVWWDANLKSGEEYDKITEDALKSAKAVVVLWSPRSVDSRWVRAEATLAQRNRTLMPAMIEACDRPVMFELTQTAELSHWMGDRADTAWQGFVAGLREKVGKEAPTPAHASQAAPVPEAVKPARDKRLLFAGIAAALLALLGVGYFIFAGGNGPLATQSNERIPVLIRGFTTSGSGDADEAALANGITEELIQRLRRIPELQIATALPDGSAPSDVFASANTVEGTIRKSGDRYQVTARLTGPSGEILWSEDFSFALADLLPVQQQLAVQISNALAVPLDVGANSRAYGGTDNSEAYSLYWQGIWLVYSDPPRASQFVEQAIVLDPNFVKAQAFLARANALSLSWAASDNERKRLIARIDTASKAALEAGPNIAESHLARAYYFIAAGDLRSAHAYARRASELDPGIDPRLRENLGLLIMALGNLRDALSIIESRALIDPATDKDTFGVGLLMFNGRFQESLDRYFRIETEIGPEGVGVTTSSAFLDMLMLGREDEAISFAKGRNLKFELWALDSIDHDPALRQMDLPRLRQWADIHSVFAQRTPALSIAHLAAYRGYDELALNLARIEIERGGIFGYVGLWHPAFAEIRKTTAFTQLVTDLGFPEVWRRSGDWGDFCEPKAGGGITCH